MNLPSFSSTMPLEVLLKKMKTFNFIALIIVLFPYQLKSQDLLFVNSNKTEIRKGLNIKDSVIAVCSVGDTLINLGLSNSGTRFKVQLKSNPKKIGWVSTAWVLAQPITKTPKRLDSKDRVPNKKVKENNSAKPKAPTKIESKNSSKKAETSNQCMGYSKKGARCKRIVKGGGYCWQHK